MPDGENVGQDAPARKSRNPVRRAKHSVQNRRARRQSASGAQDRNAAPKDGKQPRKKRSHKRVAASRTEGFAYDLLIAMKQKGFVLDDVKGRAARIDAAASEVNRLLRDTSREFDAAVFANLAGAAEDDGWREIESGRSDPDPSAKVSRKEKKAAAKREKADEASRVAHLKTLIESEGQAIDDAKDLAPEVLKTLKNMLKLARTYFDQGKDDPEKYMNASHVLAALSSIRTQARLAEVEMVSDAPVVDGLVQTARPDDEVKTSEVPEEDLTYRAERIKQGAIERLRDFTTLASGDLPDGATRQADFQKALAGVDADLDAVIENMGDIIDGSMKKNRWRTMEKDQDVLREIDKKLALAQRLVTEDVLKEKIDASSSEAALLAMARKLLVLTAQREDSFEALKAQVKEKHGSKAEARITFMDATKALTAEFASIKSQLRFILTDAPEGTRGRLMIELQKRLAVVEKLLVEAGRKAKAGGVDFEVNDYEYWLIEHGRRLLEDIEARSEQLSKMELEIHFDDDDAGDDFDKKVSAALDLLETAHSLVEGVVGRETKKNRRKAIDDAVRLMAQADVTIAQARELSYAQSLTKELGDSVPVDDLISRAKELKSAVESRQKRLTTLSDKRAPEGAQALAEFDRVTNGKAAQMTTLLADLDVIVDGGALKSARKVFHATLKALTDIDASLSAAEKICDDAFLAEKMLARKEGSVAKLRADCAVNLAQAKAYVALSKELNLDHRRAGRLINKEKYEVENSEDVKAAFAHSSLTGLIKVQERAEGLQDSIEKLISTYDQAALDDDVGPDAGEVLKAEKNLVSIAAAIGKAEKALANLEKLLGQQRREKAMILQKDFLDEYIKSDDGEARQYDADLTGYGELVGKHTSIPQARLRDVVGKLQTLKAVADTGTFDSKSRALATELEKEIIADKEFLDQNIDIYREIRDAFEEMDGDIARQRWAYHSKIKEELEKRRDDLDSHLQKAKSREKLEKLLSSILTLQKWIVDVAVKEAGNARDVYEDEYLKMVERIDGKELPRLSKALVAFRTKVEAASGDPEFKTMKTTMDVTMGYEKSQKETADWGKKKNADRADHMKDAAKESEKNHDYKGKFFNEFNMYKGRVVMGDPKSVNDALASLTKLKARIVARTAAIEAFDPAKIADIKETVKAGKKTDQKLEDDKLSDFGSEEDKMLNYLADLRSSDEEAGKCATMKAIMGDKVSAIKSLLKLQTRFYSHGDDKEVSKSLLIRIKGLKARMKTAQTSDEWNELWDEMNEINKQRLDMSAAKKMATSDDKATAAQIAQKVVKTVAECDKDLREALGKFYETNIAGLSGLLDKKKASELKADTESNGKMDDLRKVLEGGKSQAKIDSFFKVLSDVLAKNDIQKRFDDKLKDDFGGTNAEMMEAREKLLSSLRWRQRLITHSAVGKMFRYNPFDNGAAAVTYVTTILAAQDVILKKIKPAKGAK